ncbi:MULTISPECIES: CBS domain-containing protein [unclassified Microbulbifer]|uniref:CBS domain-containing protein n=1 Tax=Microbulbifer spongiae TaxID=2944933 RepID=A0ABY9EHP3_9GAMM|nr:MULTISPECIES: CBS domain-containing protein [unclassified Microbulbifer]MDP5209798.1 CBS domain-containing protein [Microbulbifer sp. 2205BS26-8]WKD50421.1 CBS domain-containing protein [Microbulbifer sp. MI-G]
MMKVKQAMHQGVTWCSPDTPLEEVATILRDEDIGAVPIGENDRLIGMVTDRDIVCRGVVQGETCSALSARDVMTEGIEWCWEEDDLLSAVHKMEQQLLRRMPVLNSEKRMVGILSLGDITAAIAAKQGGHFASAVSAHH